VLRQRQHRITIMAATDGTDSLVAELEKLSLAKPTEAASEEALNRALRDVLERFASKHDCAFEQDNIGNIYITRIGADTELSPIAICCAPGSSITAALNLFKALSHSKTACGITLVDWSTPFGAARSVGREVWEGTLDAADGYKAAPRLKEFAGLEDAAAFSLSAIFEVGEATGQLVASGSPVLTDKVQRAAEGAAKVEFGGVGSKRAPVVRVSGRDAVEVGKVAVEQYSRYIVGLFENFD